MSNDFDIKEKCLARKWKYNVVSAYLIEIIMTPYELAKIMGISRALVSFWLRSDELSNPVQFLFLFLRKLWLQENKSLRDFF